MKKFKGGTKVRYGWYDIDFNTRKFESIVITQNGNIVYIKGNDYTDYKLDLTKDFIEEI